MPAANPTISCVLFDLDGTLVDTAPDIIACLNRTLDDFGLVPVEPDRIRPYISFGARTMITASQTTPIAPDRAADMLDTLHSYYLENIAEHSVFFSGMTEALQAIEALGLKWGVVTNKLKRFTEPLMAAFNLSERAACIISGDSAAKPKPHPAPMLAACRQAGVKPETCVYIGDAAHDIAAGKSVQMRTLAALYGYLKPDDRPENWGADALIEHPDHILPWIRSVRCR